MTFRLLSIVACSLFVVGCGGGGGAPAGVPQISPKVNPRFAVPALLYLKEVDELAKLADATSDEEKTGAKYREVRDAWAAVPDSETADPMVSLWVSCRALVAQSRKLMEARTAAKTDPAKATEVTATKTWIAESVARVRKAIAEGEALRLTEPGAAEAGTAEAAN